VRGVLFISSRHYSLYESIYIISNFLPIISLILILLDNYYRLFVEINPFSLYTIFARCETIVREQMENDINYSMATSDQIEQALGRQIEKIRLLRSLTQVQLAKEAGVTAKTIYRIEREKGGSLNTFIRVMQALGLSDHLQTLLPDPTIRPMERVAIRGNERKRARPSRTSGESTPWQWGDEKEKPE
jgi:transcriptional regulator with XRE-family HTH domain